MDLLSAASGAPPQPALDACVGQLESLCFELNGAMSSVAQNALSAFEQSLWRQKVLCTSLAQVMQTVQAEGLNEVSAQRLQTALKALHTVTQTYTAVIAQASASNQTLCSVFCNSFELRSGTEVASRGACCSFEA